ncbi:MAG: DUF3105 domain-containing protein [Nocardioides sp.]
MSEVRPEGPAPYAGPWPPPAADPEPPRRNRLAVVIAVVAAVVVLALAVAVPVVVQRERDGHTQAVETITGVNLDRVQVFSALPRDHTTASVPYRQVPPVGGPHDPVWLDCGVYDTPVRNENAVHDLEHGAVWITYDPSLGGDDVAGLAAVLLENGIMSPYDGLPSPVVVTVWGAQLDLTGADDPRLPLFLAAYSDGHTAPEPFASCAGGVHEADPSADASGSTSV